MNRVEKLLQEAREALDAMEEIIDEHNLEDFLQNTTTRFALRYTVIQFWEALSEALYVIVETRVGRPPSSFRESVETASRHGLLSLGSKTILRDWGRPGNMVVHRYWEVDDERLYKETKNNMETARRLLEELEHHVKAS